LSASALALALVLAGCGEPAPSAVQAPAHERALPTVGRRTQTTVAGGVWTGESISSLQPVLPTQVARTPAPTTPNPALRTTIERLRRVVKRGTRDPNNPWAIVHGLLAEGADFPLPDGGSAIDHLFEAYAVVAATAAGPVISFPREMGETGEVRVEPHKDMILKVLTEIGTDPERPVTVMGQAFTVADLYRSSLMLSYLEPASNHSSYDSPNDTAWSIQALSMWAPDAGLAWSALDGTPMKLRDLAHFGTAVLTQETQFMVAARAAGENFSRGGQGIFSYTCGGAHLLQGVALAAARGHTGPKALEAIQAQAPLMFYRLTVELEIYDKAMKEMPDHALRLLVQRLKFSGHFLETMHKMAAMGLYAPSPADKALLDGAAQQVVLVMEALDRQGVFANLSGLRAKDEQLYLDIIGDSAHALNGLLIALAQRQVRF
jgi:hypothetical protein